MRTATTASVHSHEAEATTLAETALTLIAKTATTSPTITPAMAYPPVVKYG